MDRSAPMLDHRLLGRFLVLTAHCINHAIDSSYTFLAHHYFRACAWDWLTSFSLQNIELTQDARAAKTYRDELDIVRDRANKADELEAEIQRYKDKVHDLHYFKSRVDEVQEDKRILVETKDMLEEQLAKARKRSDQVLSLEKEILSYKTALDKIQMDRESDKQRIDELTEENYALQMSTKSSFSESRSLLAEMQVLKTKGGEWVHTCLHACEEEIRTEAHLFRSILFACVTSDLIWEWHDPFVRPVEEEKEKGWRRQLMVWMVGLYSRTSFHPHVNERKRWMVL